MDVVNTVINHWVSQNAGKLWSGLTTGGLSSSARLQTISWLVG
jgi:hypothetical protein